MDKKRLLYCMGFTSRATVCVILIGLAITFNSALLGVLGVLAGFSAFILYMQARGLNFELSFKIEKPAMVHLVCQNCECQWDVREDEMTNIVVCPRCGTNDVFDEIDEEEARDD